MAWNSATGITMEFRVQDFESPHSRQAVLRRIAPIREIAEQYHSELLEIFRREMEYRNGDSEEDNPDEDGLSYFENIYWCAFLLFILGYVKDVPLIWKAKNLNMDVGSGMDWQFLVGAGLDETINFAFRNKLYDLVDYLRNCQSGSLPIMEWAVYRCYYFYGRRVPQG